MCICLFVWVNMHTCLYIFVHGCGGQRTNSGVFPQVPQSRSTPYFVEQGFSLAWNSPSKLSWLANKPQGAFSLSQHHDSKYPISCWNFLAHGLWGLNTGPHACKAWSSHFQTQNLKMFFSIPGLCFSTLSSWNSQTDMSPDFSKCPGPVVEIISCWESVMFLKFLVWGRYSRNIYYRDHSSESHLVSYMCNTSEDPTLY